ncbi:MAG TPA: hypothetical protein VFQ53_08080 [Kofleriaceae bacterium]|nr:hypothetical protein [Kofleriaceae bacterium]
MARLQRRRKLLLLLLLAAAILLAVTYGTCGRGWGIGTGKGNGDGDGSATSKGLVDAVDAAPKRCQILVASEGIIVDGVKQTRDGAVAACKPALAADVVVAGDARQGDWDDLKAALDAANIEIFKREPRGTGSDATDAGAPSPTATDDAAAIDAAVIDAP